MFWISVLSIAACGFCACKKCANEVKGSSVEWVFRPESQNLNSKNSRYAPLPHYNATNGAVNLGVNSDDDDDEEEDDVFVNVPTSQAV